MSFSYDKVGNLLTKTDYQGDVTRFTYDGANRRVAMQNPAYLAASYQHDGAGRVVSRSLSNGAQTQYEYDQAGRLTALTQRSANGAVMSATSYSRDRVGNVLTQRDGNGVTTYGYDALYRLASADYPGAANDERFEYDDVGNRTSHTQHGQRHVYEYWPNSNRVKAIHAGTLAGAVEKSFIFDDEGRLTQQNGLDAKTIGWDGKSRASVINGVSYRYDALNYRIGQSGGSLGAREYYLEGEHLEAEYVGANLQTRYFRGLSTDELLAGYSYVAGRWTPAIYHHDALMSVTGISSHNGAALQTRSYSAFGDRTVAATGGGDNRLSYTGREKDADSGLLYYRARYYDPSIGRFISEDPKGFEGSGVNWYAYVDNNPVNGNDPSGLASNPITAFIQQSAAYLGIKASGAALQAAKERGIAAAWKMEQQLVRETGQGTRAGGWTPAQVQQLLDTGKVRGFVGDHINSANASPTLAGLSDNIQFLSTAEHTARHSAAGGTQVPLYGSLIDRTAGGTLPRLADSNGYSIKGALLGAGAAILSGVAEAAGSLMDAVSPWGLLRSEGLGGCNSAGVCSDMVRPLGPGASSSYGPAAGGFLLYPNKPNTNQMQSIYRK